MKESKQGRKKWIIIFITAAILIGAIIGVRSWINNFDLGIDLSGLGGLVDALDQSDERRARKEARYNQNYLDLYNSIFIDQKESLFDSRDSLKVKLKLKGVDSLNLEYQLIYNDSSINGIATLDTSPIMKTQFRIDHIDVIIKDALRFVDTEKDSTIEILINRIYNHAMVYSKINEEMISVSPPLKRRKYYRP